MIDQVVPHDEQRPRPREVRRSRDSRRPAPPQRAHRRSTRDVGRRSAGGSSSSPSATSRPRARASRRKRALRSRSLMAMSGSLWSVVRCPHVHSALRRADPPGRDNRFPSGRGSTGGAGSPMIRARPCIVTGGTAMQDSCRAPTPARGLHRSPPWLRPTPGASSCRHPRPVVARRHHPAAPPRSSCHRARPRTRQAGTPWSPPPRLLRRRRRPAPTARPGSSSPRPALRRSPPRRLPLR